jgi:hypothetical protein
MFGQIQEQLLTDRVSCHSPNWVSCYGIDLAGVASIEQLMNRADVRIGRPIG